MKVTIILLPEADGGYSVIVPALPGTATQGDSLEEALENAREVTLLSLEVRQELGLPGPIESPEILAQEIESCLRDRVEEGLPLTIETRELEIAEVAA
jgi:predicted RNase H-like HicB family nuclease